MAEKKTSEKKAVAPKKVAAPKKASASKAVATKKSEVAINSYNVGFRAGDVYQALATAEKAMSVEEIAKAAKINEKEVLLGMGWLLKEGKIKDDADKVTLA